MDSYTPFYIQEVIDGSTFTGWFELFDVRVRKKVKLVNIKCHSTTVAAGQTARKFMIDLLQGKELYCKTFKDKYQKWATILAILYFRDGDELINVNDVLIEKAMAFTIKETNGSTTDNSEIY